jgi:hypothetical protein
MVYQIDNHLISRRKTNQNQTLSSGTWSKTKSTLTVLQQLTAPAIGVCDYNGGIVNRVGQYAESTIDIVEAGGQFKADDKRRLAVACKHSSNRVG